MDDNNKNNGLRVENQGDGYGVEEADMATSDDEYSPAFLSLHRLKSESHKLQARWDSLEDDLLARDAVIAELTAALAQSEASLKSFRNAPDIADTNDEVISRDKQIDELRSTIQELETYIDGRKADWKKLNVELDNYRNALVGMEKIVRSRAAVIQEHEDEKSALAGRIIELEQQMAELGGRRGERELMSEQLQTMFDERGQQIDEERVISGALREERENFLQKSADLEHALEQERSRADSLQVSYADAQSSLIAANAKLASLQGDQTRYRQQLADIEQKYDEHQSESVELRAALKEARGALTNAEQRLSVSDAKTAELAVESQVFNEEITILRDALMAKNQLVATLEAELTARKETIALLDRNEQSLSESGDDAQAIDRQIARTVRHKKDAGESAQNGSTATRLMVAMTGEHWIKFPLYKESMTIGRSTENDIQLRWKYISRNHARIICGTNGTMIEDLGSKNGIYVNNQSGRSFELHNGDRVEIGEVQFEYIDFEEQAAAATQN